MRHYYSATSGRGGLGELAGAEGLARRLPHSCALLQREIFMCVRTWELREFCFPEPEALFGVVIITIPF